MIQTRAESTAVQRTDLDWTVDHLLADWHVWRSHYRITKGHSGTDATCRDYRPPGHWDWANGAADARADDLVMRAVDHSVGRVPNTPQPWNLALQFEARNLHSGAAVWSSPALPKSKEERAVLVLEARNLLVRELRKEGVVTL